MRKKKQVTLTKNANIYDIPNTFFLPPIPHLSRFLFVSTTPEANHSTYTPKTENLNVNYPPKLQNKFS